jgi:hypothetical protein
MRPNIEPGTVCLLNGLHDIGIYSEFRPFIDTQVRVIKVCQSGLVQIETMEGKLLPFPIAACNLTFPFAMDQGHRAGSWPKDRLTPVQAAFRSRIAMDAAQCMDEVRGPHYEPRHDRPMDEFLDRLTTAIEQYDAYRTQRIAELESQLKDAVDRMPGPYAVGDSLIGREPLTSKDFTNINEATMCAECGQSQCTHPGVRIPASLTDSPVVGVALGMHRKEWEPK